ncbi:MAG: FmdE family protein [Syntrophomonadaceae bacterium]|jgi:formylmethanofuran dehydrogenase subunit E|nr:FmdE family protein [Syntrophomonadaceae bacterium]MDH7497968.1 FmdE family protein [Syntrophomonadaceae bacterium]
MSQSPLEKAVQFHRHVCPGLLMGVRAAEFALQFLRVSPDRDEELVAIVETDSCAVDAIQAVLGCTFGKGNLVFLDHGKHVYTIASRERHRAVRIAQKWGNLRGAEFERFRALAQKTDLSEEEELEREELRGRILEQIMSLPFEELFDYREVQLDLPPRASIHPSVRCVRCGEGVMQTRAVETGQGWLCRPCAGEA